MTEQTLHLSDLLSPGTTMMLVTQGRGKSMTSRPLTVAEFNEDTIRGLVDGNAEWAHDLDAHTDVHVTVSDTRENTWVSLNATASLSYADDDIDRLWNPVASAYFDDGRKTPGIAVLSLVCSEGRYWTSPSGRLGSLVSVVRAALGSPNDSGEHGEVALT
jgi:general stress protein 26